jgi:hypothetical protein
MTCKHLFYLILSGTVCSNMHERQAFRGRIGESGWPRFQAGVKSSFNYCPDRLCDMNDQTSNLPSAVSRETEIEVLARETGTPVDTVQEIYRVEHDKLERSARVKNYVSVLTHRRVKALLQVERGNRQ